MIAERAFGLGSRIMRKLGDVTLMNCDLTSNRHSTPHDLGHLCGSPRDRLHLDLEPYAIRTPTIVGQDRAAEVLTIHCIVDLEVLEVGEKSVDGDNIMNFVQ